MTASPTPPRSLRVRAAVLADADVIVGFNRALASETEGKALAPDVLSRGVRAALEDPDRLRYWVAEDSATAAVLGQAAVTREWSDWRDGWFWWFQSVYVLPEARGRGVFHALHDQIRRAAVARGDVVGLRLYVEHANARAQRTYRSLGLLPGGYHVFEEVFPPEP